MMDHHSDKCKDLKSRDENILALKIYDQCRFQLCVELGPVVSNEHCECFLLLDHGCGPEPCRMILPGCKLRLPEEIIEVKIKPGSFKIKHIEILDIAPSPVGRGFWDVTIRFVFVFRLQMFDEKGRIVEVVCCGAGGHPWQMPLRTRPHDSISCRAELIKQVTLFGSNIEGHAIASDIFAPCELFEADAPHVLAEAAAQPMNALLKTPHEAHCFDEVFDDVYCEPARFVFVVVGLFAIIRMFRLVNLLIEARLPKLPHLCIGDVGPCEVFETMDFPDELFHIHEAEK